MVGLGCTVLPHGHIQVLVLLGAQVEGEELAAGEEDAGQEEAPSASEEAFLLQKTAVAAFFSPLQPQPHPTLLPRGTLFSHHMI